MNLLQKVVSVNVLLVAHLLLKKGKRGVPARIHTHDGQGKGRGRGEVHAIMVIPAWARFQQVNSGSLGSNQVIQINVVGVSVSVCVAITIVVVVAVVTIVVIR